MEIPPINPGGNPGNDKPKRKPLDLVTANYDPDATLSELTTHITTPEKLPDNLQDLKDKYEQRYNAMFGSDADAAERVRGTIREQINDVASRLVNIATNSPNERLAADVGKFLLDRTVFRAGQTDDELSNWLKKMAQPVSKAKEIPQNAPDPNPMPLDDPGLDRS